MSARRQESPAGPEGARLRKVGRAALLLSPLTLVLLLDLSSRAHRLAKFSSGEWRDYVLSVLLGGVVWGALLFAASRRRGAGARVAQVLFVLFFSIALGGQAYFFEQYGAYLNADVARFATDFTESVLNQLWADRANYFSFKAPAFLLSVLLVVFARKLVRPKRTSALLAGRVAPLLFLSAFVAPVSFKDRQACAPDMLYLNALGTMLSTQLGLSEDSAKLRPRARASLVVPKLEARPARPRNVVFVIGESIRQDAVCSAYDEKCERTPATNRLFQERIALSQLRALDSSTAISMAVLWSGLGPHETREALHTWPLLFDYARAADYTSAYFTSQNILFGNLRLWLQDLSVDSMLTGNAVDPESNIDLGADEALFSKAATAKLGELKEPFFLTIQLSNGHYPYLVHEARPQPFQPASTSKAPEKSAEFFNYYKNAIHQQDLHLAKLLAALKQSPAGARTVVVYTSDHGEAFREHHQMGHTFSIYDEEVLVPAWIDAPEGTLSEEERAHLLSKKDAFSFHPDLSATILDLLGVWDDPKIARFRQRIIGTSLLRPELNERALPMTNCSAVWSCAFENWGMMRGHMKLEARAWDPGFHCWDLKIDPEETLDLGAAACGDLEARALSIFGRKPGKGKK
jgi:glucan phosphoethanolaminetransferase (alkaline phosphatase superfamily)